MYGVQLITGPALFPWNTTVPLKKKIFFSFVFRKSWSWVQTRSDYGTGSWHRWRVSLFTDSTGSILFPQNINSLFLHYNTVVTKHTVRPFSGKHRCSHSLEKWIFSKWGGARAIHYTVTAPCSQMRPTDRSQTTTTTTTHGRGKTCIIFVSGRHFFFSPHILSDKIHLRHDDVERAECAAAARRHTPLGVR